MMNNLGDYDYEKNRFNYGRRPWGTLLAAEQKKSA